MQGSDGTIIGQKGVKYGLQKPVPKGTAAASTKARPVNVFGDDSDEEENVGAQVMRQADKKRAAAKVQAVYEAALADDPSVFDYDGVYDRMQEQKVQPKQQEKIERKSRYIAQLKDQAEERKKEADVAFERKTMKDRVKEDHLFADKEVFVTGAYRRKLEEQKKWIEDEKRKEEEEERQDVRKVGHMGNFYANLLNKNVAFGTSSDVPKKTLTEAAAAPSAAGASSLKVPDSAEEEGSQAPGSENEAPAKEDAAAGPRSTAAERQAELAAAAIKAGVHLDKYDLMRMEAERAMRAQRPKAEISTPEGGASSLPAAGAAGGEEAAAELAAAAAAAAAEAVLQAGKRRNDELSVQSARDRYLARKKQNPG